MRKLVILLTLIVLHLALFKNFSNQFPASKLNYYVNIVKSSLTNKSVEVAVNNIDIQQSNTNPDKLLVALLVSEKNTGDSVVSPANFTLTTKDGLVGDQKVFYGKTWQPLDTNNLSPGQQKEGAIFFEIPKSDAYTFTYNRGALSTNYKIPSEEALFIPFVINPVS